MKENENFINNLPLADISSGFLLGLAVGYFFKKSFKIMLFVVGLLVVVSFYLNSQNVIELNGENLLSIFDVLSQSLKKSYDFIYGYLTKLEPIGGASIVAGFLLGLKIG